jgi:hypothetical protein
MDAKIFRHPNTFEVSDVCNGVFLGSEPTTIYQGGSLTHSDIIQIVIRSSVDDDPFGGPDSTYSKELNQFLRIAESQGGKAIQPRLTMDSAEIQTVLEFAAPLAHDALKILGAALIAWIHGRAGRRTEVSGFGIKIKTSSAEDAKRLIDQLEALQKKIEADDKHD